MKALAEQSLTQRPSEAQPSSSSFFDTSSVFGSLTRCTGAQKSKRERSLELKEETGDVNVEDEKGAPVEPGATSFFGFLGSTSSSAPQRQLYGLPREEHYDFRLDLCG